MAKIPKASVRFAALSFLLLSFPALVGSAGSCERMEVRPLLVNEAGVLPDDWSGEAPADVVSWADYLACFPESPYETTALEADPDDAIDFATDWETSTAGYGTWTSDCVNAGEALAECQLLTVPGADPGLSVPVLNPLGASASHNAWGHYQVITMPSQGTNKASGCHYTAMNDARAVMEETFFFTTDFSCWLGWNNNQNLGNPLDNAKAYAAARGWDSQNYLVMAWVHNYGENGLAPVPGHVALGVETCPGACYDWRHENIAQHEMSHLLNANHPSCGKSSIMNICKSWNAGAFHRHYDRTNLERICDYTDTCVVVDASDVT